jgi:hypothetical protein
MENQLQKLSNLHLAIKENSMEFLQIQKRLNVEVVLKNSNPVFNEISKNESQELETMKIIDILCQRFILQNYPDSNHIEISRQFTLNIMGVKTDWKVEDIIVMFKFVIQNQHIKELKVMGNKINALKLMEFANIYDDFRANERAKIYKEIPKAENSQMPKNVMDKLMEIVTKIKSKPKKDIEAQIFEQKKKDREIIAEKKRLQNLALNGDITEMEAVDVYNEFLKSRNKWMSIISE